MMLPILCRLGLDGILVALIVALARPALAFNELESSLYLLK
jgi:hypothetical protein